MPLGASRLTLLAFQATVAVEAEVIRKKVGVSANGNAQIDTAQYKFSGSSALFDGSGDYLDAAGPNLGSGEWTIEMFARFDSVASVRVLYDDRESANTASGTILLYTNGTTLYFNSQQVNKISGGTLATNTWYHIAVTRDSSNDVRMFLDGTEIGTSYNDTSTFAQQDGNAFFGMNHQSPNNHFFDGYIDEVRFSNTARYTSGFTPTTVPFTNDDNTLLLIHASGTDASTFFEDDNGSGRSQTSLVGQGNADHSSNESKFGGSSFYVDGSGGDGVLAYLPSNPTAITVEGWYRFNGVPSSKSCMFAHNRAATGYSGHDWFVTYNYVLNDWSLNMKDSSGTTVTRINSTANAHENTNWHHMAVCMEIGGYARMFIDGTLQEEVDISGYSFTDWTASLNRIWLGHWYSSGNNHSAYYDEFRISDSIRYTASFTAPTTTFVNDANTLLLFHADGQDNSTVFRDDNGSGRTPCNFETIFGGELDTAQSKFGVSSWYNDADGDGVKMVDESPLDSIGTGAFTIECFVRKDTDITGLQYIFYGNNQQSLRYDDTNNTLEYCADNGETTRITGGALSNNTWYHIAVSRSGTTTKLFIDGTQSGSDYTNDDRSWVNNTEYLLAVSKDGDKSWRGHIDEFRVSNTARYTEDFTAPTEPFQNDGNTLMLLHLDGTDASTVIIDDNGYYQPGE